MKYNEIITINVGSALKGISYVLSVTIQIMESIAQHSLGKADCF